MKNYSDRKLFCIASLKNVEESEERSESVEQTRMNLEYANTKNIHNKSKEYK